MAKQTLMKLAETQPSANRAPDVRDCCKFCCKLQAQVDPWLSTYPYILAEIKGLLNSEKRQLFLKNDSMVANYLGRIIPEEVVDMQLGDYPALEALGIVVAEMRSDDISAQQSMRFRTYLPLNITVSMKSSKRKELTYVDARCLR